MKKKSFASILILALVMTTLAGCGKNESKNDKPPVDTTSETVTEVTTVTETEAQIEAETDTQTETETEVEDKTDDTTSSDVESGTVSEKKTSGDTTEATTTEVAEYWDQYPLTTDDGKKVYIKKTNNATFDKTGFVARTDDKGNTIDSNYEEQWKYDNVLAVKSEHLVFCYSICTPEAAKANIDSFKHSEEMVNEAGTSVTVGYNGEDTYVMYTAKIDDNNSLLVIVSNLTGISVDISQIDNPVEFTVK